LRDARCLVSKKWTLAECFKEYKATPSNPRWSWSARSEDGKTVVLTLWQDRLTVDKKTRQAVYDSRGQNVSAWADRNGNRERLENLKWALDHCDGQFRVIITVAKDKNAIPREIVDLYPQVDWVMRITDLNENTGEFRAVSINK